MKASHYGHVVELHPKPDNWHEESYYEVIVEGMLIKATMDMTLNEVRQIHIGDRVTFKIEITE